MRRTLKISLDFLAGPLRKDEFIDGGTRTGIPVIVNDVALQTFNARIAELNDGSLVVDDQETPRVEAL